MSLHRNRVQMTVTSVDGVTGELTLGSATTGYQSFSSAYGADATVDILITEGTSWEVARNCTYTNSGTTVSRGTFEASSSGSAVSFTSAAIVSVIATAGFGNDTEDVVLNGGFVYVTADGTNTQTLTPGSFNRIRGNNDSPSNGALRTEVTDERGWWDAGVARFQPTIGGKYLCVLSVQVDFTAATSGTQTFIPVWYKNGSSTFRGVRVEIAGTSASLREGGTATVIVEMNGSSDYLEPYVYAQHTGSSSTATIPNLEDGCYVTCRFLGR